MKPIKTFFFLVSVFLFLLLISILIPEEGIRINDDYSIRFKTWKAIFNPISIQYADISNIMEISETIENSDTIDIIKLDTIRANADSLKSKIHRIEFPNNNNEVLHPFFSKLQNKTKNRIVRIMHYGDSQIEGDRITSFLRNRLQKKFGGCGAGLIPIVQTYDFEYTVKQDYSDNWKRYTAFGKRDTTIKHYRYGALANFSRFTPVLPDSLINDSITESAWFTIEKSNKSFYNVRTFHQCRVFYGYNSRSIDAEVYFDDELYETKTIPPTSNLNLLRWTFSETPEKIEVKLSGSDSPEFYGVALDGYRGVAVDNIAMRGCSGLIFTRMNQAHLKEMFQHLNTDMLILQFGGNMVPYLKKDFDFYENRLYQELMHIKKLRPGIVIILIGVADMSTKEGEYYVTFPNIVPIRDAMKSAAFRANCGYWDLYEAMGGENSMPSWVYAQPKLATSDFTHFNHRGARVIAEMFYKSFLYEYEQYQKSKSTAQLAKN